VNLWIAYKNQHPNSRIRDKTELRPATSHRVENTEEDGLEAPERHFVLLSSLDEVPSPSKVIKRSFRGVELEGVYVTTGKEGWFKCRSADLTEVKTGMELLGFV
jgi:hypothetical protein